MAATDVLVGLGFTEEPTEEWQALSDAMGLSENYPHKVLSFHVKGDVAAMVEQNVSEDESGGVPVIMKHPAILILESPKGRVAIPNHDDPANAELIVNVVNDLS